MIDADRSRRAGVADRSASELGRRVGSALVMAAAALVATWSGGWPFTLLWLCAAAVIFFEWVEMSRTEPRRLILATGVAGLLGAALAARSALPPWIAPAIVGVAIAVLLVAGRGPRDRLWASSGILYASLVLMVPVYVRDREAFGAPAILWIFAVVWLTDIGGYFVGRAIGGPKLAPSISPGKTWSGFGGGLLAAILAGAATVWIAARSDHPIPLGWAAVLVASALASVAGQVGDLGESAMKRLFAVKDSGRFIPGHGGLMDRLDGFVPAGTLLALALAASQIPGPLP